MRAPNREGQCWDLEGSLFLITRTVPAGPQAWHQCLCLRDASGWKREGRHESFSESDTLAWEEADQNPGTWTRIA